MIAGRRKMCEEYARAGQPVYSYGFATRPFNAGQGDGVKHFVNVVFSFQNISGSLGVAARVSELPEFQSYQDLSTSIGRSYVNFVNTHDPGEESGGAKTGLPTWPRWIKEKPTNMVLNPTKSEVEEDNFRVKCISFTNSISRELSS